MSAIFDHAFEVVIGAEGGFNNDPEDPGNWTGGGIGRGFCRGTRFGISARSYPDEDIEALTPERAKAIYAADFWAVVRADDQPPALALLVFDAAVNNGPSRAAKWLQQVVGTVQDGRIGEVTLGRVQEAATARGVDSLCVEYLTERMMFIAGLALWQHEGLGWTRRLFSLPFAAVGLLATVGSSSPVRSGTT